MNNKSKIRNKIILFFVFSLVLLTCIYLYIIKNTYANEEAEFNRQKGEIIIRTNEIIKDTTNDTTKNNSNVDKLITDIQNQEYYKSNESIHNFTLIYI